MISDNGEISPRSRPGAQGARRLSALAHSWAHAHWSGPGSCCFFTGDIHEGFTGAYRGFNARDWDFVQKRLFLLPYCAHAIWKFPSCFLITLVRSSGRTTARQKCSVATQPECVWAIQPGLGCFIGWAPKKKIYFLFFIFCSASIP